MIEANRYKLGLFVISGIALLIMALFLLGLSELFATKVRFMTLFDESVQGLEVGAPVKLRGVTIGKVSKVAIRPSDNYVRVEMEAQLSAIDPAVDVPKTRKPSVSVITKEIEFFEKMEKEVEKGLRCRLDLSGITGMKYVEINYFDPQKSPVLPVNPPKGTRYIPSTRSFLGEISTSFSKTLARLATVNFEEISEEMVNSLKFVNNLLNDPRINNLIQKMEAVSNNLETTSGNINKVITENALREMADNVKKSLVSINELSKSLQKQVEEAKIASTAEIARTTLRDTSETAKSIGEVKEELSATLTKLDQAIDSFAELVSYLGEDPAALLRGKQKKPERDLE